MRTETLNKFEKEKTASKESNTRALNILWVDDEIEFLRPHILYLEQNGYKVSTASNGIDALMEFEEHPFDIIFLDQNMPGLSGIETMARMKEINSRIPIVLITKNESETVMKRAVSKDVADYLVKPVSITQVFACLHKILFLKRPGV